MVTRRGLLTLMAAAFVAAWLFGRLTEPQANAGSEGIAPDIAIASSAGEQHLAALRGKVVLVAYFATWWPPSRSVTYRLERLYRRYRADGFEVMGVSLDASPEPLGRYVRAQRITYPVGLPVQPGLADQYAAGGLPALLLVDKRGVVRWRASGPAWEADGPMWPRIEELLQE